MDFKKLREKMVKEQIIPRGITDKRVINAMLKVERHLFVTGSNIAKAYLDMPLPIGKNQTISQPYMVAVMTELLEINKTSKVLEIGTGSGYQTAILAEISDNVFTVERLKELSEKAKNILNSIGYKNIRFKVGDGSLGWEEESPFDRIICTAASPEIPEAFKKQLACNGKIVIPVGDRYTQSLLEIIKKKDNEFITKQHFLCTFVPLIGKQGWTQ